MLKRDELLTATSCLNKATDDEPIFVLRANDELAPDIVRQWAAHYRAAKAQTGQLTPARDAKAREAEQLADDMEYWRENRPLAQLAPKLETGRESLGGHNRHKVGD